ncbi:MAG TPA: hypothetical protein VK503_11215, partial [Candidatus Bathyarchaeia archaeon]|nr:hypothetical protein [Candidatus Bathyarchaeia archaeon]
LLKNGITVDGILTNGLGETRLYKAVADITRTNWLVNVMNPATYTPKQWDLLNSNLETLKWMSGDRSVRKYGFETSILRHLCLAITFYERGQDYRYIIELAKKYGSPVVRYDFSRPASNRSNIYVDFEELAGVKSTSMDFVKACVEEGIKPAVDCAIPLCLYTQEELRYLHLFSNFYAVCTPHMDVMPDLTVEYCTSMHGILPSYRIGDMSVGEIFNELFYDANKYRRHALNRCRDCYNYDEKSCQGYCLQFKSSSLEEDERRKRSGRITDSGQSYRPMSKMRAILGTDFSRQTDAQIP